MFCVLTGINMMSNWLPQDKSYYPGTQLQVSDNEWMTSDIFFKWFCWFCSAQEDRPLLLIYDGHSTHINLKLIKKAREEDISLLKLPPHTTDRLQPLDVCCFKPLKTKWDEAISKWTKINAAAKMTNAQFVTLTNTFLTGN